jgi:hypothetical protein
MVRWRRGAWGLQDDDWGLQDYYNYFTLEQNVRQGSVGGEGFFFCSQFYHTVRWTRRAGGEERGKLEKEWADWEEEEG